MKRVTAVDVAIDPRGDVVVVWAEIHRRWPPRASVTTVRLSGGQWSAPERIATFSSPRSDVGLAPFRRGLRPQVLLYANGAGVAVWARLVAPEQGERFGPATAKYVVDAATMSADGAWSTPRTLGETNGFPDLDVAATGDAVAVWTRTIGTATTPSSALVVAMRSPGGAWATPEILIDSQTQLADGIPVGPGGFFGPQVVLTPDGRIAALWQSFAAHVRLEASTRSDAGQWSTRKLLDRTLGTSATFLNADRRGEVTAVWMTRAVGGSNDQALWAATQDPSASWAAPTAVIQRSRGTRLTNVAMSAGGRVIALIERETYRGGEWRSQRIEAYLRTPGHVWSRSHPVSRVAATETSNWRWRSQRAQAALADDGSGVIVWAFDAGVGRRTRVMSVLIAPP